MRNRSTVSIVASPVLVGAITTLVVVVAVFLAYNANTGLPFVPTYDVTVKLPGGANLVEGNEVRVGGFRVGVINRIRTSASPGGRAVALADMQLDKTVEELPVDTTATVRPRSSLGLKYIELVPGADRRTLKPGSTIPMRETAKPTEIDDFLNTFDEDLRKNSQISMTGFGNAFAGRGESINVALQELPAFFAHLTPVMDVLNDSDTELDQFFRNIGRASAEAAPVARIQAEVFSDMADTFEAFSRHEEALRATIEKSAPTMQASIESFQVQTPFLRDFTTLTNQLRPAARAFRVHLPAINRAFRVGQPVLERSPRLNRNTERLFRALDDLVRDPNTLLALKDLTTTTAVARPLVEFVAPYQTVCNLANYFFTGLGDHQSEELDNGYGERVLLRSDNGMQDDRVASGEADRPADVPKDQDPTTAKAPNGRPLTKANTQAYWPAIDSAGNADCQSGQFGYPDGPLARTGRYPPANFAFNDTSNGPSGGSHVLVDPNTPGLAGPTFTGVPHLRDVDRDLRRRGR